LKRFGAATLLAFDLIFFAPLASTGGVFSSHDFVRAQHPWRMSPGGVLEAENRLLSDEAASGQTTLARMRALPRGFFWNPWVSSGSLGPFLLAQGFLSPFAWLPALLLPEAWIETGILFLKFNAAFVAMYVFLRSRRFADIAAAAGAATWAFSTAQTVWGLWMHTSVSVTYPLLLMAVDRAFEEKGAARAVRFAALSLLLCFCGGFPHWVLYGAFASGLLFVLCAAGHRLRGALAAAARLAAASAIASAILFPSILVTARFLEASGYRELRRGLGSSFALPLRHLRLYFVPDYQGTPRRDDYRGIGWIPGDNYMETAAGVGLAAAGLAFLGLSALRRRREALFAAILGVAVAIPLYAGGPALSAVGRLPLLDIGLFARAKILIVLAVAILAACGAEALERVCGQSPLRRLCLQTAPFLIAVPLAFLALDFYPECRPGDAVYRDTPGTARLRELLAGGSRFAAAGWTLIPNVSEPLGLDDARGHFLLDERYRRLVTAADPNAFGGYGTYLAFDPQSLDPASPVLDLLGVRFLAAPPGVRAPVGADVETRDAAAFHLPGTRVRPPEAADGSFPVVYGGPDMTIFERPSAFARFRLVAGTLPGGVEQARAAKRAALAEAVFVAPDVHERLSRGAALRRADGRLRVGDRSPERFVVETESAAPAILVSSQKAFRPYWRLFLDGREAEALEVNGLFLGLEVPAGSHRIEGRFLVPRAELAVSLAGLLALAATMMWASRERARA
jgi:hypothetical protein